MKLNELIKPGLNIILCNKEYNIIRLKNYLRNTFTIVDYNGLEISSVKFKGDNPDLIFIDARESLYTAEKYSNHLVDSTINLNDIVLCVYKYDDFIDLYENQGSIIDAARVLLIHITDGIYNVLKLRDYDMVNTIIRE